MPFTQVQITGIITVENEVPAAGAQVQFLLSKSINDGATSGLFPLQFTTVCGVDGSFSVTVPANDDPSTSPAGTYYTVKIYYQGQYLGPPLKVVVPYNSSSSIDLFSLLPPASAAPNIFYVAKIIAGPGVNVSPSGGTGVVTLSVSPTFAVTVGNGTGTTFTITHNLGSTDVLTSVVDLTTNKVIYPTVTIVDTNNVSVQFSVAPTINEMRVVVMKA
jgi:hypothetical protein